MTQTQYKQGHDSKSQENLFVRPWMVAVAIGLTFVILRFGVLNQPPVWDGAMGMTPAALTLEAMDFDISRLLELPDYQGGGPNVHALSLATWFVAVAIRLAGSYQAALPFLHMVSFALIGTLAAGVFRAVQTTTSSNSLAWVASGTAVVFPPMVVQASDVYLDLPLAVGLTWAFAYLIEGRLGYSIALLTLAAAIKPSAMIAIPPTLYFIWRSEERTTKSLLLLVPAFMSVLPLIANAGLRASEGPSVDTTLSTFWYTLTFLSRMPILIGLLLFLSVLPLVARTQMRTDRESWLILLTSLLYPISFIYFFLFSPLASRGVTGLPRYTTMFLPIVVVGLCVGTTMIIGRRKALLVCLAVACVFSLNLFGDFEPLSSNAFWMAERSLAYENLLDVQIEAFYLFAEQARTMPSLYDHFAHYRIKYPETGWIDTQILSGHNLNLEKDIGGDDLPDLPDEFVMLIEGNWLGGLQLQDIRDRARNNPDYSVDIIETKQGEFSSQVVIVTRLSTAQ